MQRARYADFAALIDPCGKVWRFEDDPPETWRLVWNDTELKKDAATSSAPGS